MRDVRTPPEEAQHYVTGFPTGSQGSQPAPDMVGRSWFSPARRGAKGGSAPGADADVPPQGVRPTRAGGFVRTTHFHTTIVSAILLFDALLLLADPEVVASVSAGSPGSVTYLIGPLVAALYLGGVLIAAQLVWSNPLESRFGFLWFAAPIALTFGLATLFLAASTGGPTLSIVRTPGFFAACLLGVSAPLVSLGLRHGRDTPTPLVGLVASVLPVPLALITGLPTQNAYATVDLMSVALVFGAVLFQVSGTLLSRDSAVVPGVPRSQPARPTVPRGISLRAPRFLTSFLRTNPRPATSASPATPPPDPTRPTRSLWPNVVSTGFRWLDELLMGGVPRRGQVALLAVDGSGPESVVASTLNEGLRRGECVVVVTAAAAVTEVAELMERLGPGFCDHDREGRVLWVDASGRGRSLGPTAISGPTDRVQILQALRTVGQEAGRRSPGGFCLGFFGLSSVIRASGGTTGSAFVRNTTAILRQSPALALFSLDRHGPGEPATRTLLESVDGTIAFRTDGDRTLLRVLGLSPVETRGWVECRFRPRGDGDASRDGEGTPSHGILPSPPVAAVLPPMPRTSDSPRRGLAANLDPFSSDLPDVRAGENAGDPSDLRALEFPR